MEVWMVAGLARRKRTSEGQQSQSSPDQTSSSPSLRRPFELRHLPNVVAFYRSIASILPIQTLLGAILILLRSVATSLRSSVD